MSDIMLVLIAEIIGVISGISALAYSFYKVGAWTGRVNASIRELSDKVDIMNVSLNNHIAHYDKELSDIRATLKEMGDVLAKK
ncbi:MAG: hypothetical protein QXW39_06175 [Candidatus Bathyarchaeia archaeon]